MSKAIPVDFEEIYPLIEEKLMSGGSVTFSPKGTSMLPLIRQGIDSVTISPVSEKLKKYDVPLYRRNNGQFVLHRIVAIKKNGYVMCGDNQFEWEYGIKDSNIIGVMTEIIKPDRLIKVSDDDYIRYCKKQVLNHGLRRHVVKAKKTIKRILIALHLYKKQ